MISDCHKTRAIADYLHVIPKTINTYRYRIFEKLQVSGDVELVLLAVRHGLVEINGAASG
jgi:DNA-binding NarL/FixJ family response regulator